jgi:ApaG protein
MYSAITRSIRVSVVPEYLAHQSNPETGEHAWAYHISIENIGMEMVQLLSRHWRIIDAHGALQEVRGDGVVGQQPVIEPGHVFRYTSGVPLHTPSGIMQGSYELLNVNSGERFDIEVPAFSLDIPSEKPLPN